MEINENLHNKQDAILLLGKPVADSMQAELMAKAQSYKEKGLTPKLLMVRVGERSDDIAYETGATKKMATIGIEVEHVLLAQDCTQQQLEDIINEKNTDDSVHGILMFRPLPKHLDENRIIRMINPEKDVDCMNPATLAGVLQSEDGGKVPCTPQAVIEILRYYKIEMSGKNVAVLGRSTVIGKPVALLLLNENDTVTVCNSKTKDIKSVVGNADIVVSAMGRAKMVDSSYLKKGAVVIDVGMNTDENGK
ncbi:MAG: bifunctional 5,10-methylenetetrahydrofolate dehydrogenase/5,10-methenyltetrahydrofolate cyclohydrolase, partial [Proteocatella sp.]